MSTEITTEYAVRMLAHIEERLSLMSIDDKNHKSFADAKTHYITLLSSASGTVVGSCHLA
jgi:hypothetical protein